MAKTGRYAKEIDWDGVDFLLQAGCNGVEVAAYFGMHPETFYDRVQKKYGICFTLYQQRENSHGVAKLRAKSFEKSIKGQDQQLTLNLKNRAGYTDKQETKITGDEDNPLSFFINQANGASKDLVSDDNKHC